MKESRYWSSYKKEDDIVHDLNVKIFRKNDEIDKLTVLSKLKQSEIEKLQNRVVDMEKLITSLQLEKQSLEEKMCELLEKYSDELNQLKNVLKVLRLQNDSLKSKQSEIESKIIQQASDFEVVVSQLPFNSDINRSRFRQKSSFTSKFFKFCCCGTFAIPVFVTVGFFSSNMMTTFTGATIWLDTPWCWITSIVM